MKPTNDEILEFAKNYTKSAKLSEYQKGLISGGIVIGAAWSADQSRLEWIRFDDETKLIEGTPYYVALKDGTTSIWKYDVWEWKYWYVTDYAVIAPISPPIR